MTKRRCFQLIVLGILLSTSVFMFVLHQRYSVPTFLVSRGSEKWAWFSGQRLNASTSVTPFSSSTTSTTATSTTAAAATKPKPTSKAPAKPKLPGCPANRAPVKTFQKIQLTSEPNVTVVTAFFDLGNFTKGRGITFKPSMYMKWASVYQYIQNPFIVYTDSERFEKMFLQMRENASNITKVIRVNRTALWGFDYLERIRTIYNSSGYPKFHPNTVLAEYSCAQHAKYACVEDAILKNIFSTEYIAWLDLGYFRYIVDRKKKFVIVPPKDFDDRKVAVNLVYPNMNMKTKPEVIFRQNTVWVGGGMFFGDREVVRTFIGEYRRGVEHYLSQSLSNTDQQVLYAMNTEGEGARLNTTVQLQLYQWDVPGDCWFFLGYSCYREVE